MKYYLRITLLTVLVFATAGCDFLPDGIEYFFSSGGSLRHGTSASEDATSDEATLVISSFPCSAKCTHDLALSNTPASGSQPLVSQSAQVVFAQSQGR